MLRKSSPLFAVAPERMVAGGFALRFGDLAGTATTVRLTSYAVADNDSDPFSVTFGEWIHIAATYNNGAIDYFLNGIQLGGSDHSLFNNEGPNARATIGARFGGNDFDQTNGFLDGIRIYDEVLTAAQIQEAAVTSVVPEPSSLALLLLGGMSFARSPTLSLALARPTLLATRRSAERLQVALTVSRSSRASAEPIRIEFRQTRLPTKRGSPEDNPC